MSAMTRGNKGRSTTGERAVPEHYPTTPDRETAAHLRLTAARYLSGRANRAEVEEAYRMFAQTAPPARDTRVARIASLAGAPGRESDRGGVDRGVDAIEEGGNTSRLQLVLPHVKDPIPEKIDERSCQHLSSSLDPPCGKPGKFKIRTGPDGKPSSIDGQVLCGRHANFWRARQFVVDPIAPIAPIRTDRDPTPAPEMPPIAGLAPDQITDDLVQRLQRALAKSPLRRDRNAEYLARAFLQFGPEAMRASDLQRLCDEIGKRKLATSNLATSERRAGGTP